MKSRSFVLCSAVLALLAGLARPASSSTWEGPPPGTPLASVVATDDQGVSAIPTTRWTSSSMLIPPGLPESQLHLAGESPSATGHWIEPDPAADPAVLEWVEPRPRTRFEEPSTVVLRVVGVDPLGALTHVTFLAQGEPTGESQIVFVREPDPGTVLEHEFHWERPPTGIHRLAARAIDALGREVHAPTILIEIFRPAEPLPVLPHPADRDPEDWRIDEGELARFATDWREGTAPGRIPIGHVTRAAYLVAEGGTYRHEPSRGPLPLSWIPDAAPLGAFPIPTRPGFLLVAPSLWEGPDPARIAVLELLPAPGTRAYAAEVWLKPDTRVRAVSEGGAHDPVAGVIRWGPFPDDAPRRLTVEWEGADPTPWDGVASFDGHDVPLLAARIPAEPARPYVETLRRLPSGEVQLVVRDPAPLVGESHAPCAIEVSRDLRTWRRIATGGDGEGCLLIADTEPFEGPARFYRVVRDVPPLP
ncbi:MAG: hypothetical protein KF833_06050 [Verrucomicrobiae bacterium]|nr:hypothetical protein [Verrucomicrobiae bacterium]